MAYHVAAIVKPSNDDKIHIMADYKTGTEIEEVNTLTLTPRQLAAICNTKIGLATTTLEKKTWQYGAEKLENDRPHGNSSQKPKMR